MAQVPANRPNQGASMTTQRANRPLQTFRQQFDDLFNRMWSGMWGGPLAPFDQEFAAPRMWDFGVTHNDKEIIVRAEIPGFEDNELNVQLDNDVLTIKAEKEQKEDGREQYQSFFRQVTLPSGIDADKVQAHYRNGVLEMHIPRPEGSHPKRIAVKKEQTTTAEQTGTAPAAKAKK
jgi:HSP20 family protein